MLTIRSLSGGVALAALCLAPSAWAQTATSNAPAEAAPEPDTQDIIVTAQRRSESLQRVPAAISALSGEQLEKQGIDDIADVASRTPSFVIGQQGPASPDLSIRGIGSSDRDAGSDRSVVVFIDEVYTGRAGGIPADLFDLERVEVLRGPQGTLYGKNAVGGAVNFITRKPEDSFSANAELSVGNYNMIQARGAIGGGLSDTLSGRLAFSTQSRDGWYRNAKFDVPTDDYKLGALRGQLRWRPSANLDVLLSGDYAHDEVDGISTYISPASPALLATGFNPGNDPFVGYQNVIGFMRRDSGGTSLRADYSVGDGTITALTAYRKLDMAETRDLVGDPLRGTGAATLGFESTQIMTEVTSSFSQELRYTSSGSGALRYIFGLYYQSEDTHRIEERKRQLNAAISRPRFDQSNATKSYAGFGQLTWSATDWLNLTVGGRYTIDEKVFDLAVTNPFGYASLSPATAVFSTGASDRWSAFTPKATLDITFAPDIMGYATVSRGFKSGGFQGLAANAAAARTSFNPEIATSYEIGLRSRLFDRRLTFNLSAYHMDFSDLQFRQRILTIPGDQGSAIVVVANAGTARINGAELETSLAATSWLNFNLGYSYLDAKITSFNATPGVTDVNGLDLARAPTHTLSTSAEATIPVGARNLGLRVEYLYRSDFLFEPSADNALREPGYGLFNSRISYGPASRKWGLELWARNIANKRYRTFAQSIGFASPGGSAATSRTGDPRTIGLTGRVRY
jgi:iron complex outermembrane receptor protein